MINFFIELIFYMKIVIVHFFISDMYCKLLQNLFDTHYYLVVSLLQELYITPTSLPGCPILYYTITILELNITNITTSTSIYYLLSDIIISNEIYTVTISATNGASTGNETMYYFNTSLGNITIYYIINTVLSSTGNINILSY